MTDQPEKLPTPSLLFIVFFLGVVFGGVIATVAVSNVERVVYVTEKPYPRMR